MKNPIAETLGLDLSGYNHKQEMIVITFDGRPWLTGQPRNDETRTWEGYYAARGPCLSIATGSDTATPEKVLLRLAAWLVGRNPKKAQVATIAATLKPRLAISRQPRRE